MERYDAQAIDEKWRRRWQEADVYRTETFSSKPTYYCLDFFPYPSGEGLSVGHLRNYIPVDAMGRYMRMCGYEVLHPMGWDAFGLPAEQDAIDKGIHPAVSTKQYAANYKRQLTMVGCGYDWSREINSSSPEYYKWTQWFFLLLHKRGLAYRSEGLQWWCETCGALANEEVLSDGTCWRGHSGIKRRALNQWFFKITEYADRLIEDLDLVDWPERTRRMQVNWVGRSEGADVVFKTESGAELTVFTTRPDTLFGATFMVLAPEHHLLPQLTTADRRSEVEDYVRRAAGVSEIERAAAGGEKSGVFTGSFTVNPVNGERIPIWVSDYVLLSYGTGAIMAVPAHDERDFEFARKYDLPIRVVVAPDGWEGRSLDEAFTDPGIMVNSPPHDGLSSAEGGDEIVKDLERTGLGKRSVAYRMRDWLISRQRYWGSPIPIVHCNECGEVPVPEKDLPVRLPHLEDFAPKQSHRSPLESIEHWVNTTCPNCGGAAKRETDTLGGFACSSWYYLRFISPGYSEGPFDRDAAERWMPVDLYVGGAEHAVMHLLFARFWFKVMYDAGLISYTEPFGALRHQGMLLAEDGWLNVTEARIKGESAVARTADGVRVFEKPDATSRIIYTAPSKAELEIRPERSRVDGAEWAAVRSGKMSKSMGNVVTPDAIVARYGADCLRGYEMFMAPIDGTLPWSENGLAGLQRFYQRLWDLILYDGGDRRATNSQVPPPEALQRAVRSIHKAVKRCTEDVSRLRFNTMIANGLMETVNDLYSVWSADLGQSEIGRDIKEKLILLLAPVAPHLAEELWERTGHDGFVALASWPEFDEKLATAETLTLVVQVNGKLRDRLEVDRGITEQEASELALASPAVTAQLDGKQLRRVVYVPGRLVNLVVN